MDLDASEKLLNEVRRRHADACLDILLKIYVGNIDVCCGSTSDQGNEAEEKESIIEKNVMFLTDPDEDSSTSNDESHPQSESNARLVNSVTYCSEWTILVLTLNATSLIFVCVAGMVV